MYQVDIIGTLATGGTYSLLSTAFSSIIDAKWEKDLDLLSYHQQPALEIVNPLQTLIAALHTTPENYEPEVGDEQGVVPAVKNWLSEILYIAYNHPTAILMIKKT